MKFIWKVLATGFGSGYSPYFPGTIGSLAAAFIIYFYPMNLWQIIIMAIIGIYICTQGELVLETHDCPKIVYDEFVGMFIAAWRVQSFYGIIGAFFLFRLFDIIKPYPINKLQELPRGWGVMADDVVAGITARIILYIFYLL